MTLNDLEHQNRGFYGFYICSQWAFIHALLSRVPFALAGLSCSFCDWFSLSTQAQKLTQHTSWWWAHELFSNSRQSANVNNRQMHYRCISN